MSELKEGDKFWLMGLDWKPLAEVTIIRVLILAGVPGFAIHEYEGWYRVSHIETGSLVSEGRDDGEAFIRARTYVKNRGGKDGILLLIRRLQQGILVRRGERTHV
jgi:hypothetical protein